MATKKAVITRISMFKTLVDGGVLDLEKVKAAVAADLSKGELKQLTPKMLEGTDADIVQFAEIVGLVKHTRAGGGGRGRSAENSIVAFIQGQFPDAFAKIAPGYEMRGTIFEITDEEGKTQRVAWQPFFRSVKVKEVVKKETGTVTV